MYATDQYLEAVISLVAFEGTALGNAKTLADITYNNLIFALIKSDYSKEEQIRILASYSLPLTLASVNFPDNALKVAKETLAQLKAGELIPMRPYDGMIAKAIQSLRYHNEFSFVQFVL